MRIILSIAMLLCCAAGAFGQGAAASKGGHDASQAKFDEVLAQTAAALQRGSYSVEVASQWKSSGLAQGGSGASTYRLTVERPAKFRIEVQSAKASSPELLCACDGQRVTTLLPARKLYSQSPASQGLARNTLLTMSLAGSGIDVLLQPNLVEFVHSQVSGVKHAKVVRNGQPVHHFRMTWAQGDLELWIAASGAPLPQQFRRTVVVPGPAGTKQELVTTTHWTWTVGQPIAPETFALALPTEAQRVTDIYSALAGDDSECRVGQLLPDLQLTKLDGTPLALDPKARPATVLIFWASWCAPSVSDLAGVSQFVKQYGERGAAFYAVNVGESISDVRRFAEGKSLQSAVVLDADGQASSALGIVDLPTAAVVDSRGNLRAVLKGSGKDALASLSKELDDLLPKTQVAGEQKAAGAQR